MSIPVVGRVLTHRGQLDECPPGTRIYDYYDEVGYTRSESGWLDSDDEEWPDLEWRSDRYECRFIPGAEPPETLAQYQWRYTQVVRSGAERNSINTDVVDAALARLEVPPLEPGPGTQIRSSTIRNALPEGSIVVIGDPAEWSAFGVWRREAERWRLVLGGTSAFDRLVVTVHEVAGQQEVPAWINEQPTAKDPARIAEFKKRAYYVGSEYKATYRWCPTYDEVVAQAGIDGRVR